MKRKITTLAALLIVASLAAYGTLAYFTDSEDALNKITTGNVDIELYDLGSDGEDFPAEGLTDIMPGSTVVKEVSVENIGDNPVYIRVKFDKSIEAGEGAPTGTTLDFTDITLDLDLTGWTLVGDWYYYNTALAPGVETNTLLENVIFGSGLGNAYMNAYIEINVIAEAVQAANNGADPTLAAGWPTP